MASCSLNTWQWSTLRALPAPVYRTKKHTCHATATDATTLKNMVKDLSTMPYRVRGEKQAKLNDLIEQLEAESPTPCPKNVMDKLAGTWLLCYAARDAHTEFGGLRLFRAYYHVDVEEKMLTKSFEFSEDDKRPLPGAYDITDSFEWAGDCTIKFTETETKKITSEELEAKLGPHLDDVNMSLLGARKIEITYEDEKMLIARDEEGLPAVLEHRITFVHA